jgi:hypothetical protein
VNVVPIHQRARATKNVAWHTDGSLALRTAPSPTSYGGLVGDRGGAPESAARAAVMIARGLLEVLSGWRPPSQLARWTSAQLQYDLERRAPRRPTGQRQQLMRVRLRTETPGVTEACALTRDLTRDRVRVMALRLELRGEHWIITRLSAG